MPRRSRRTRVSSGRRKSGTKNVRRSRATRKGWVKRTRREGFRQVLGVSVSAFSQTYGYVKDGKDFSVGVYKFVNPRGYRKHGMLEGVDKFV